MDLKVQKNFIRWAFNEPFPTDQSKFNRMKFLQDMLNQNKIDRDTLQYWLQEAFHEGAKSSREINFGK